jgi:hypothetical protein
MGSLSFLPDLCRGFYRVWVYGGYSGDLSPQLTLELLAGKEDAILIDVRPEAREQTFWPFMFLSFFC